MSRKKKRVLIGLGILGGAAAIIGLAGKAKAAGTDSIPGTPTEGDSGMEPDQGSADLPPVTKPAEGSPVDLPPVVGSVEFDPGEHEGTYPTPRKMYQVRSGDIFGGTSSNRSIAYRALLSEAYVAAIEGGASDAEAKSFANEIASSGTNRLRYIDAILCAGVNDAVYGTWGYAGGAKYGQERVGPHGRTIRLMKYHPDNRARLTAGKPMRRNIALGDYMSPGDGSGVPLEPELAEAFEFLFLPGLDRAALRNRELVIAQWEPPFDWSVDVEEEGIAGNTFGCEGGEILLS